MVYTLAGITAGFIFMGVAGPASLAAAVMKTIDTAPQARVGAMRERLNSSVAATSVARDVRRGEDIRRR